MFQFNKSVTLLNFSGSVRARVCIMNNFIVKKYKRDEFSRYVYSFRRKSELNGINSKLQLATPRLLHTYRTYIYLPTVLHTLRN